ncbi:MAG: lipopolysaccharide transport periplasmic protein LptA [Gammaproteobacteria bacterium RIFCSPLOWO2_02_FULL_61_13]|nr:MAG: lipopolysaccharide transport periplasmic protein LptA [Gammaproteobacteria bacterium RIFCSPLOWO2_02_FULL_61_13]
MASRFLPGCALGLILAPPVHALSTDKDQPIEVEADTAELDDVKNVSIYRGNVIVIQGSIRMTGDLMTVYQTDSDDLDHLIMEGNPATYKQLPDDSKIHDEARALRMEYHEIKNKVILINQAVVTQEGLRFSGDRIDYDTELSKVKAWSKPPAGTADAEAQEGPPRERVKIIIKKKNKGADGPELRPPDTNVAAPAGATDAAAPDPDTKAEVPEP